LFVVLVCLIVPLVFVYKNKIFARLANSVFQVTWIYFIANFLENKSLIIVLFVLAHLPILLVKHLVMFSKLSILILSVFYGIVLMLLFTNFDFPTNILMGIAIHFLGYLLFRPIDQRFKFKIIN